MAEHEDAELAQFGAELAALRKLLSELHAPDRPFVHGERTERERPQDSPERVDGVARENGTRLPGVASGLRMPAEIARFPDGALPRNGPVLRSQRPGDEADGFDEIADLSNNPDVADNITEEQLPDARAHGEFDGREEVSVEASEPIWQGRFDADWYLTQYPDVAGEGWDPLEHFIQHGLREGRQPNARAMWERQFDAEWYLKQYTDVARAGLDPLDHFLGHGLKEGRRPSAPNAIKGPFRAVTDAQIYYMKQPSVHDEVALFVTHSPNGRIKPHVSHYLKSLMRHDVAVVLIVAADRPLEEFDSELADTLAGVLVRQNTGYDFAAWAHVLLLHPELFDTKILYFVNDSLFGPTNDAAFGELLRRVRNSSAAVIGLTEDYDRGWHLQSYFLAFKQRALASVAFQKFVNNTVSYVDKADVINQYEIQMPRMLREAGLDCERLFSAPGPHNPTLFHWKQLLQSGFPFLKVETTREGTSLGVDISGWGEVLAGEGYDVSLATQTLDEAKRGLPSTSEPAEPIDRPLLNARMTASSQSELKIAFIGPWNYNNGLGFAGRGYISALRHSGLQVNLYPIRRPFHIHQQTAPAVDICDFSGDPDVAIVHINPDGWPGVLTEGVLNESQMAIIRRAKVRVCAAVWEITALPSYWRGVFDNVDAIWAPSRYCADIFDVVAKVPVDVIPYVVPMYPTGGDESDTTETRRALGLRHSERFILYAFDGSSYLARKNPFALIRSFARSGLAQRGWRLVLKTKHSFDLPEQGKLLQKEVSGSAGVVQIDRSLDAAAMRQLMRAADIYASPHCAEGFGLTIAEAMAMGKIVVATDYSGSRDFLDVSCGFPVPYQLRELGTDLGPYARDAVWAHVDEGHLADSLIEATKRVISRNSGLGEAARSRVGELLSPATVAMKMRKSLTRLVRQL